MGVCTSIIKVRSIRKPQFTRETHGRARPPSPCAGRDSVQISSLDLEHLHATLSLASKAEIQGQFPWRKYSGTYVRKLKIEFPPYGGCKQCHKRKELHWVRGLAGTLPPVQGLALVRRPCPLANENHFQASAAMQVSTCLCRNVTTRVASIPRSAPEAAQRQYLHYLVTRCATTRYERGTEVAPPRGATGRSGTAIASHSRCDRDGGNRPTYPRGESWPTLSGA